MACITEMPTAEPMLRTSVVIAAPSVRNGPGTVEKANVLEGMKTNPSPTP